MVILASLAKMTKMVILAKNISEWYGIFWSFWPNDHFGQMTILSEWLNGHFGQMTILGSKWTYFWGQMGHFGLKMGLFLGSFWGSKLRPRANLGSKWDHFWAQNGPGWQLTQVRSGPGAPFKARLVRRGLRWPASWKQLPADWLTSSWAGLAHEIFRAKKSHELVQFHEKRRVSLMCWPSSWAGWANTRELKAKFDFVKILTLKAKFWLSKFWFLEIWSCQILELPKFEILTTSKFQWNFDVVKRNFGGFSGRARENSTPDCDFRGPACGAVCAYAKNFEKFSKFFVHRAKFWKFCARAC